MEKTIATVFKILGGSLILLLLLDLCTFSFDTFTTLSRVNAVVNNLEMEISRYNGLPSQKICDMYGQKLVDCTLNRSNVASYVGANFTAHTNVVDGSKTADFNGSISTASDTYDDLGDLKEYGDMQKLCIRLKLNVFTYTMTGSLSSFAKEHGVVGISYVYDVPCLKYTK